MRYFKLFLLLVVVLVVVSCFKDSKEGETTGIVLGTFVNNSEGIYVISDTLKGTNGAEIRYYFENEDTLKNVKDGSRMFFAFKLIKERETLQYLVECLYYSLIPIRKIVYVEEDDNEIRDTLAGNSMDFTHLSISHDFLNIGTRIAYDNANEHFIYITRDALDQNGEKDNEVILNLYHRDIENKFPDYYKDSIYYISVPVKELQDFFPKCDTINIIVQTIIDKLENRTKKVVYETHRGSK